MNKPVGEVVLVVRLWPPEGRTVPRSCGRGRGVPPKPNRAAGSRPALEGGSRLVSPAFEPARAELAMSPARGCWATGFRSWQVAVVATAVEVAAVVGASGSGRRPGSRHPPSRGSRLGCVLHGASQTAHQIGTDGAISAI